MLPSLGDGVVAAVFGATGGIGAALTRALGESENVDQVYACARRKPDSNGGITGLAFDLEDEESISEAVDTIGRTGPLHAVFVATGVLHGDGFGPEKRWRDFAPGAFAHVFAMNTTGPALIAKHTLDRLACGRKSVFCALSARVGSIDDNALGGWHAYRASKAALNMVLRSCAVELAHKNPDAVCAALHPGTVDTALSQPFRKSVPDGKLFSPAHAASRILDVADALGPADSGGFFAWDGTRIAF